MKGTIRTAPLALRNTKQYKGTKKTEETNTSRPVCPYEGFVEAFTHSVGITIEHLGLRFLPTLIPDKYFSFPLHGAAAIANTHYLSFLLYFFKHDFFVLSFSSLLFFISCLVIVLPAVTLTRQIENTNT